MSWSAIKTAFQGLNAARTGDGDFEKAWTHFTETVDRFPVPYHLQIIMARLSAVRGSRDPASIRILDHGCGGCLTLFYLRAKGYTQGYGVDVGGYCEDWNRFVSQGNAPAVQQFHVYDGVSLPFEDAFFDFIFSQEVIEHVRPSAIVPYYAEEARVLKSGGVAFHRVPHRLGPYDSHTRTWFIHYLPRGLWLRCLKALGRDLTTAESAMFLRWPWVHRRLARRHIGVTEDVTLDRIRGSTDLTGYEGSVRLRRVVGWVATAPLLRWLTAPVVRNFSMLDTISIRN